MSTRTVLKDEWWKGKTGRDDAMKQGGAASAYESLGGSFTDCVENISGVDDPEGFCAWLKMRATGATPGTAAWNKDGDESEVHEVHLSLDAIREVCPECAEAMEASGRGELVLTATDVEGYERVVAERAGKHRKNGEGDAGPHAVSSGAGVFMREQRVDVLKSGEVAFTFSIPILKAYEENGKKYIEGVASDDRVDKDDERMSPNAIREMVDQVIKGAVPLLPTHQSDWDEEMGRLVGASVSSNNEFLFKSELDEENPKALRLWQVVKEAKKKLGASIGGGLRRAYTEFSPEVNKIVKVIDSVRLDHVAVTGRPANPRTWLSAIAKSVDWDAGEARRGQREQGGNVEKQNPPSKINADGKPSAPAPMPTSPEDIYNKGAAQGAAYDAMKEAAGRQDSTGLDAAHQAYKEAAMKARMDGGAMKEDEAEVEAEAEATAAQKIAEAEAKKAMEHPSDAPKEGFKRVTMTLSKEEADFVKEALAKRRLETDPVMKALGGRLEKIEKALEGLAKGPQRRSLVDNRTLEDIQKTLKEDIRETDLYKKAGQKEQIKMLGDALTKKLGAALGVGSGT